MGKCKKCGTVVTSPRKKWTMAGRLSKAGKRTQLEIGLFDCSKAWWGCPSLNPFGFRTYSTWSLELAV